MQKEENILQKSEEIWQRKLNVMIKRDCNSARRSYVNRLSEELVGNNPKAFLKYVNLKRKGTNDLILLKVGGQRNHRYGNCRKHE